MQWKDTLLCVENELNWAKKKKKMQNVQLVGLCEQSVTKRIRVIAMELQRSKWIQMCCGGVIK